jgi:hypothetical protein
MIRLRDWLKTAAIQGRLARHPVFEITEDTQKVSTLHNNLPTGFYSLVRTRRTAVIHHIESGQAFEVNKGLMIEPTDFCEHPGYGAPTFTN